jgi:beta-glucanase (GH16 family)
MADRGRQLRRTDFSKKFHTFAVEWSKDYLFTYLDSRLQQVLYWKFDSKKPMWDAGNFASQTENATFLTNPWENAAYNAPFDQSFYLILNVAVGSRNGWFKYVSLRQLLQRH